MARTGRILAAALPGGALAAGGVWAWRDYHAWLALGQGGQPSDLQGWRHVTRLRFKMRDQLDLTDVRAMQNRNGDISTLKDLPLRKGPRPLVAKWAVPQRQTTQNPDDEQRKALQAVFDKAVADNPLVDWLPSHFEKHILAVTISTPNHLDPVGGSSLGEVAHIHDADGSLHMILSPTDATAAIQACWAQFHGLSGLDHGLPLTYVMVYGPRSDDEVEVIGRLLQSSLAFMLVTGQAQD